MTDHECTRRNHEAQRRKVSLWPPWKALHREWRYWVAVMLALVALVVYVMSMDEALQAGAGVEELVPASRAS